MPTVTRPVLLCSWQEEARWWREEAPPPLPADLGAACVGRVDPADFAGEKGRGDADGGVAGVGVEGGGRGGSGDG